MISKKELVQFIPRKYEYLLKNEFIVYSGKTLKTAYFVNIINDILIKYYFHKNDLVDKETNFNLWSVLLKKKYGMDYNYYINYLMDFDFMKIKSDYLQNVKARTFSLNLNSILFVRKVFIKDKVMLKKASPEYLKNTYTEFSNSPIDINIRRKLVNDLFKIQLDTNKALKFLKNLKQNNIIDYNKFTSNYISIENISNENLFFKFDEYGRMHTNFTILKKEIRHNFIKINNEDICEIDIKNSQPLFLTILMKKEMRTSELFKKDVSHFIDLVNNHLLYEFIQDNKGFSDRKDAKLFFYKVFFGVNKDYTKDSKFFIETFPTVYNFIKNYKIKMKDYKELSHVLQRMESDFIFNKVIKDIMNRYPEITLFTIHDSICFQCRYRSIVEEIFNFHMNLLLKI